VVVHDFPRFSGGKGREEAHVQCPRSFHHCSNLSFGAQSAAARMARKKRKRRGGGERPPRKGEKGWGECEKRGFAPFIPSHPPFDLSKPKEGEKKEKIVLDGPRTSSYFHHLAKRCRNRDMFCEKKEKAARHETRRLYTFLSSARIAVPHTSR